MSFFGGVSRAARRGFDRMIEARQRQANRYVNGALLQMSDDVLRAAGYDRKELRRGSAARLPF